MRIWTSTLAALVVTGMAAAGCGGGDDEPAEIGAEASPEPVTDVAAAPDTTSDALWAFLQSQDYRQAWRLWPGKGELYQGVEPHGMLLTTYANDVAWEALAAGNVTDLPEGAILVKENYMPDSTFAAATVMQKVTGYNPDHADWLFAKYQPDGTVDAYGRAEGCQACHLSAPNAYVYTPVQ